MDLITDTISGMKWQACFEDDKKSNNRRIELQAQSFQHLPNIK